MQVGDAPNPPNAQRPKSHKPHSAWKIALQLRVVDGPEYLQRMQAAAVSLLRRAGNGGTECPLRVVIGVGDMTASADRQFAPMPGAADASSGSVPIYTSNNGQIASASFLAARITLFFIFDGDGRLKASVKRSIKNMEDGQLFQSALAALEPWPLAAVLAYILERPSQSVRAAWLGVEEPLLEYLQARVAAGNQTTAERVRNSADLMCAGMDMLGPHARKRLLPPASSGGGSSSEPVLASPSKKRPEQEMRPQDRLTELLSWCGALSEDEAVQTAGQLLTLIQSVMEENAQLKIQAAAAPDPPNVKVCMHSSMLLSNPHMSV